MYYSGGVRMYVECVTLYASIYISMYTREGGGGLSVCVYVCVVVCVWLCVCVSVEV